MLPEWANFYFKWWGIYTQGDGVGATGGKGGEGVTTEWFMMRIGIPNGILTSHSSGPLAPHTKVCAQPGRYYRRQAIQLHWLTIESLPEVVDALDSIGLSPKGACGDVVRNVTGCPWPEWPGTNSLMRRLPHARLHDELKGVPDSSICPANSRSPPPGVPRGAAILRSTTSR